MTNKIFKVALVGCGGISGNHLTPLCNMDYIKITSLCDKDITRAAKKAEEYSLDCNLYDSFDKMLSLEELDAVHIATPHYLHASMAIADLKKGIHVFLEKPLCITEAEIEAIIAAEKESSASLCVCFQNRYNPSTIVAKKLIEEDGGALNAFATVVWNRSDSYYLDSGWRGKYATEGGGVMINQAIHTIDLLRFIFGIPKNVIATTSNHTHKSVIEVEDTAEGIIGFESGAKAHFYFTTTFRGADHTSLIFYTKNHKIEIKSNYVYLDEERIPDQSAADEYLGKACYGNSHGIIIEKFYRAIINGTAAPVGAKDAGWALKILLSSYNSTDAYIELS